MRLFHLYLRENGFTHKCLADESLQFVQNSGFGSIFDYIANLNQLSEITKIKIQFNLYLYGD